MQQKTLRQIAAYINFIFILHDLKSKKYPTVQLDKDKFGLFSVDEEKQLFERCVELSKDGNSLAYWCLGTMCYYKIGTDKNSEAFIWFQKAADMDHAESQYLLAKCYKHGIGVDVNLQGEFGCYQRAVLRGHVIVVYDLAICYQQGCGVQVDKDAAVKYFKIAAHLGNAEAQYVLGWCYAHGRVVAQDHAQAKNWYEKAAEQGHLDAQIKLINIFCRRNQQKDAFFWCRKAAKRDDVEAQKKLGYRYEVGLGVKPDKTKTLKWYRKAAEQNDAEALRKFFHCFFKFYYKIPPSMGQSPGELAVSENASGVEKDLATLQEMQLTKT